MRLILTTLFSLLIIQCSSRCKYFVFGAINETCDTIWCSCCVNRNCEKGTFFINTCVDGCIDGHRGQRCYEMCTYDCKSCRGDINICETCHDGFYVGPRNDCTSMCPANCKTCTSNSNCDTCKSGFYNKEGSSTCDFFVCPSNCECDETNCVVCNNGFYDIDDSCNETCPMNCLTCSSFEHCSKCKNGFYNGYGPDGDIRLSSNDCTHKCRDTCTRCSSYDSCLKCQAGKYGLQCQENCSVGCNDNICLIETGKCNCTSNFSGEKCTKCDAGKYGNMCEQICPSNCKNGICHRSTGDCTEGCIIDYMSGAKCDLCVTGRYGKLCENICSENCKHMKCDKSTGNCSDGCKGKPQAVSADNSTVAVLATLLAVACAALGFLMLKKIVTKIRSANRHPTESLAKVHFENSLVEEQSTRSEGQTAVSDEENVTYEVLDKTEESEHAYDLPKRKTPQSTNTTGNKEYANI